VAINDVDRPEDGGTQYRAVNPAHGYYSSLPGNGCHYSLHDVSLNAKLPAIKIGSTLFSVKRDS